MADEQKKLEAAAALARLAAGDGLPLEKASDRIFAATGIRVSRETAASEIRRWFSIFAPEKHRAALRRKRVAALTVMQALPDFRILLTGPVLAGDALEDTPVSLLVACEDEKTFEMTLLGLGVDFEVLDTEGSGRRQATRLCSECNEETVIFSVMPLLPRMKGQKPDPWQLDSEAASSADADTLISLLTATKNAD